MHPRASKRAPSRSASASTVPDIGGKGGRGRVVDRAALNAAPIEDSELDALFAPLGPFSTLILAVSGGADSMAMLHLVARWSQLNPAHGRRILVATVDHGLRPDSRAEAERVAQAAQAIASTLAGGVQTLADVARLDPELAAALQDSSTCRELREEAS